MRKSWVMSLAMSAGLLGSVVTASAAPAPAAAPFAGGIEQGRGPAAATGPATVKVVTNAAAGTILTDDASRTLYLFTRDERNKSNCTGPCLVAWPPLLTLGAPKAGAGVAADRLGTITLADGSMQVTYNGWPLYYFRSDTQLSDVKGQGVGNVWFVVSSDGGPRHNASLVKGGGMGATLTDLSGRTLYMYTRDEPNKSNCYGTCALNWPPLLSIGNAKPDTGVDPLLLGLIRREDGSTQVTYKGMPLYYWFLDEKPGDMKGQGVGNVWYLVATDGSVIRTAAPAAPAAPAALPRTGEQGANSLLAALAGAGALAAAAGVWARRRLAS